ncbi:MAG TPA: hypothetical protein VK145_00330 [Candidatus Nanoarchaeia archaeon]|nr:hypothetical protein [Candidatus Nanoarchaeia archaeon]
MLWDNRSKKIIKVVWTVLAILVIVSMVLVYFQGSYSSSISY